MWSRRDLPYLIQWYYSIIISLHVSITQGGGGVSSKCANYSLFSIQRWKGVFTGVIGYRFTWRYVMIARRGLLPSSLEGKRWKTRKRWRRTRWRNSRALSNRRECSCGRRLRGLAATPSRDRSSGGNPPWDQLSYASREAVFPYLPFSLFLTC